jgi:hypothetical protein
VAKYDELDLIPAAKGRDWLIERRPLRDVVEVGGLAGVIGWLPGDVEAGHARQLLLREPSELPTGRCPLFVCELCGDLGCGAITARVTRVEDCYVWSELSSESPLESGPARWLGVERDFYFAVEEYEALLMPLTRRGRRR